jgi:hypothetical protein
MISAKNGNVEMCKLLIDNGALSSINTANNVNNFVNIYMLIIYLFEMVICVYMLVDMYMICV